MKLSIGVCCYNEEKNVYLTYTKICDAMKGLPEYDYEILFADNDSKDNTQLILREIAKNDSRVKVIFNKTNVGIFRSGTNLEMNRDGDAYLCVPCDLQEPIEMIPQFVRIWEQGYDVVWGQKTSSKENRVKFFLRKVYYKIMDLFSDYHQYSQVTGFGIISRHVSEAFMICKRQDPLLTIRHFVAEQGYKVELVPYEQNRRINGKSSYNLGRLLDFSIVSLCECSTKPLRLMTIVGMISGVISLLVALFYFVYKLLYWDSMILAQAPLIIGLFFMTSVQLFSMGILGEYIGILLRKVTSKPIVIEKDRMGFEDNTPRITVSGIK